MEPLRNPRHEKFVQALLAGMPANQAYEAAGYSYHEGNASRLRGNEKVQARLSELQAAVAKDAKVTTQSLINELEDTRVQAKGLKQMSAAVRASEAKARISGLMTERVEITTVHDRLEACETIEQLARKLCLEEAKEAGIDRVAEVSEEDMEFAHALLLSWLQSHPGQQIRDRFASSRAKPVHANQEYIERKRLGLVRSNGNGQQGR